MGDVKRRDVDGGWAWVGLMASALVLTLLAAFEVSIGIFQVEILESFHSSQGMVALIAAISFNGQLLLGPVAGVISDLVTHRVSIMVGGVLVCVGLLGASFTQDVATLLFFMGLVCGTGTGLCYTSSCTAVITYFYKYRTAANGVCLAAPGIAFLTVPSLLRLLITEHGWRYAMSTFACILAQLCVLGSLLYPHDPSMYPKYCCSGRKPQPNTTTIVEDHLSSKDDASQYLARPRSKLAGVTLRPRTLMHMSEFGSMTLTSSVNCVFKESKEVPLEIRHRSLRERVIHLLCNKFMWVMCLNQFLVISGFATTGILFPAYAQSVGVTLRDLPPLYIMYGVSLIVTRLIGGVLFNLIPTYHLKGFFCFQLGYALVLTLIPVCGMSFNTLLVCKLFMAVTYGGTVLLISPILVRYVGLRDLPIAFGGIMLCSGLGGLLAPPVAGLMYDVFGDYRICYFIAGPAVGVAALSLLLLLFTKDLTLHEEADITFHEEDEDFTDKTLLSTSDHEDYNPPINNDDSGSVILSTNEK